MKILHLLPTLLLLLISCENDRKPVLNSNEEVDTEPTQTFENLKYVGQYYTLPEYQRWLNFWDLTYHELPARQVEPSDVAWIPMDDFNFDTLYAQFFIFSPDSNFFLDLDSYNLALERENDGLVSNGFEVDTEIVLYDVKNRRYRSVFSYGTSCKIETAFWINNDAFCLLGWEENYGVQQNQSTWNAVLHQYFTNSNREGGHAWNTAVNHQQKSYLKEIRLKDVKFE